MYYQLSALVCYKVGSKIDQIPLWPDKHTTVFQAEITAIQFCVIETLGQEVRHKEIAIYVDTQETLMFLFIYVH